MADNKDKRSLWKRVSEGIQTFVPKDPGSYSARKLSIETQRENAINWLAKQPFVERSKEEFGTDLPSHLLKDAEFAVNLHERFGTEVAEKIIPLEVRRSTDYQASTSVSYQFLNAALQHDERSLQLEVKDHDKYFSQEDRQHAVDTVRRMGSAEALQFIAALSQGEGSDPQEFIKDSLDRELGYGAGDYTNEAQREALNALSDSVLGDKEFLLDLDKLGVVLVNLPHHVKENDFLMRDCLEQSPAFFEVASSRFRSEQVVFDQAMKNMDSHPEQAAANYSAADKRLREEPENFLCAHQASMGGISIKKVPESIRNDKSVIEELLLYDPNALRYASRELRKDRQFILEMTEKYQIDVSRETLIKDRQVAINLTKTDSITLDNLPENLQADRGFVESVMRLNGNQLQFTSDENQDDYELARIAVSENGSALAHCSKRLKNDPSIVYKAVESSGNNIVHASSELRDNFAMGMHAVQYEPWAVQHLSDSLRNNLDIAKEVIDRQDSAAFNLGSEIKRNLIASLSAEDREQYEFWYSQSQPEMAGKYIAKGLEPYLVGLERDKLESQLEEFREQELLRIKSSTELTSKQDIAVWLKQYGVEDFTINDDLTVDVGGDVNLKSKYTGHEVETDIYVGDNLGHTVVEEKLSGIPFQFGKVEGNFDISDNGYDKTVVDVEGLKSLKGCPTEVKGNFNCSANPALRSLEDGPKLMGGNLNISNTSIVSLDQAPRVSGQITADGLPNLADEVKVRNEQAALMAKLVAPYDAAKEGPLPSQVKKPKQVMKQKI